MCGRDVRVGGRSDAARCLADHARDHVLKAREHEAEGDDDARGQHAHTESGAEDEAHERAVDEPLSEVEQRECQRRRLDGAACGGDVGWRIGGIVCRKCGGSDSAPAERFVASKAPAAVTVCLVMLYFGNQALI